MKEAIQEAIGNDGWWIGKYTGPLMQLAQLLGEPVPARIDGPLLDKLVVRQPSEAHRNSLSSRYGTGAFPLHTDGAHHAVVPKYVILRMTSERESSRGTVLMDFRNSLDPHQAGVLSHEPWIVRTGRRAFLSSILDGKSLRFDFDIMVPALPGSARAPGIVRAVAASARSTVLKWTQHLTVIIDNHRVVHGRESVTPELLETEERQLERILVREDELEI